MKKLLLFLLVFSATNLCAQSHINLEYEDPYISHVDLEYEDPYLSPSAPGYKYTLEAVNALDMDDTDTAIQLFEKAAKKGSAYALGMLGRIYSNIDIAKAYQYFNRAADLEYAGAYYYLGKYYYKIKDDKMKAFYYFKASADKGFPLGVKMLAYMYANGIGTNIDRDKVISLLEPYALKDDVYSISMLSKIYFEDDDYENAHKWLKKGAEQNDIYSLMCLATCYAYGLGISVDINTAHELLNRAEKAVDSDNEILQENKEEVHAYCLTCRGFLYIKEEKTDKAEMVWQQLKQYYPKYIEENKYDDKNTFIPYMYAEEQKKLQLANNVDTTPKTIIVSDIDSNIPENSVTGKPIFAVIIANENYKDVKNVPMALHDGEIFKQYCEKTLGIPQNNIRYVADATLNNIRRELNWLNQVMDVYQGEATIIFYYAGHGIPNESNGAAYLLPIDGVGNDITTGYSLDKLYSDLNSKPAKSIIVILDACFSGSMRDGDMLTSARGVAIKAKQNAPTGNVVVLSATQGDETAYPYSEKGHGLFTYYLLKKIQEAKGDVTLGELSDYVTDQVKKQSIVINGKAQTPTVLTSPSLNDEWKNWKFK